ncbi:MAG: vitamin B12 dependent-methionine synthase activation domain-containing protein [Thermodesulfobacteriota bacterium]|nr:vitamin B12 dependent-methionine synthase activation domain-containing protein [Thermodesulfobacteriota bacterium]
MSQQSDQNMTLCDDIDLNFPLPRQADLRAGVVLHMGYPDPTCVTGRVMEEITKGIRACQELVRPKALLQLTSYEKLSENAIYGKGVCIESTNWKRLTARMTGVHSLCCLAVTLGDAVDTRIKELGKSAVLKALVLDAAASVMAEYYANQLQQRVHACVEQKGYQASARFSPGYCDWPMADGQRSLFPFLCPETIGISATPSGLMIPRKSITAVIILADEMPAQTPCFLCARDCPHRRAPYRADTNNRGN